MILFFKDIGRNKACFKKQAPAEITYDWLYEQVKPYLLSNNLDFLETFNGTITVLAGMQTVGEIIIEEE
jgi:hypothetical protein